MFYNKKKYSSCVTLIFAVFLYLTPVVTHAESIAVIYPDIREPYLSIFKEIIYGIDSSVSKLKKYRIKENSSPEDLQAWVKKKNISTIIALGKKSLQYAENLPDDINLVSGATLLPPKNINHSMSGITLSPSPDKLFERLHQFSNKVKTVTVIYNKKNNGWLIEYATQAAKSRNITLRAMPADDLAIAANLYRQILNEPLDNTHAIWFLQDNTTIDSRTILPTILNKAWKKRFIVFSSNPAYVKRGILFSLFPDNKSMGSDLGKLALEASNSGEIKNQSALPLSSLKIAVNLRASEHLGLIVKKSTQRGFDLVFPPRH